VEVLGVSRAVEAGSGDSIFQVTFGVMAALEPEMRQFFPLPAGTVPPSKMGFNTMVLFFNCEGAAPYTVGSQWTIEVLASGEVNVRRR
jgi:hypothetical protein